MPKSWALGAAIAVSIGCSSVCAQTIPEEYAKLIQEHSRIGTLDGGFFGDQIGLSTGSLSFVQTDVALPGNNALPVRAARRFAPGSAPAVGHFGDWELDIPHLHGVFAGMTANMVDWVVNAADPDHRCSEFNAPPEINSAPPNAGIFSPDEYWQGTFFYLPGGGDQELLLGGDVPATGGGYPATTREGAIARCLSALASTSESGRTGEGFEVVTPDGTTYKFDQMVSRNADSLHKTDPTPLLRGKGNQRQPGPGRLPRDAQGSGAGTNAVECCTIQRREFFLYPTTVTDRFGNTVTYVWDSSNPWRLLHIIASDGRQLDFTYSASDSSSYRIISVSDPSHAHTWTYAYSGNDLVSVMQPDQQAWQFALADLHTNAKPHPTGGSCDVMSAGSGSYTGTITAPSGAAASYTLTATLFGRSWALRDCYGEIGSEMSKEPYLFAGVAITAKTITGPGLPGNGLKWTYAYGPPNHCWTNNYGISGAVQCAEGTSPTTRTTTVTEPDNAVSEYTFGNRVTGTTTNQPNEGLLLIEKHGIVGGVASRTTTIAYGDGDAAPYSAHQGSSLRRRGDWIITGQRRPQASVTTALQGGTFSWSVPACSGMPHCFDARARPTTIVRSGPGSSTRTEATTYYDNEALWVLGQVSQVKCIASACGGASGTEMSATTYDAATALPLSTSAFGKLQNTFTYDTASAINTGQRGTLLTVADGKGNTTTYTSWKRGIPRSVVFADSTSRSAVVNDFGWIDSVTDENGYATSYAYDAMGRITQVTYPTGDSTTWNSTTSTFAPVASAENGLAAGHWKETVHTGNGYKVTLFDALWRPVLAHEYDSGASGTDRYVATAYDTAGRVADASYPLGSAGSTLTLAATATSTSWQVVAGGARPSGVRTSYDALGRPTLVQQDSELGVLTTTTDYLNGFQRRVTDARGNATTEWFMAWDSPSFDLPVRIDAPEHQRTTITRDPFGKPTAITRTEVAP